MKKIFAFISVVVLAVVAFAAADRVLNTYQLIFREAGGANTVTMQPPTLSANYSLTLPTTDGGANEVLQTDGSGVLSWAAVSGLTNPMTTAGDLIYGGASGTPTRLAAGAAYTALTISNSNPAWIASTTSNSTSNMRIEYAYITNGGSCAVSTQSGTWITSVSDPGGGQCGLVWASSTWSQAPWCQATNIAGSGANTVSFLGTTSTTGVTTLSSSDSGSVDSPFHILCAGPR